MMSSLRSIFQLVVIICVARCITAQGMVRQNVYFNEIGTFSISNARWLMTFTIDLEPYTKYLKDISNDLSKVIALGDKLIEKYEPDERVKNIMEGSLFKPLTDNVSKTHESIYAPYKDQYKHYHEVFIGLQKEIGMVQDMHRTILTEFNDFKLMYPTNQSKRSKRSIFSWIGSGIADVFGFLTSSDIESVKRNINRLYKNQVEISHSLDETISVVNISRIEIKENRQKINSIIDTLTQLNVRMEDTTLEIKRRIFELHQFLFMLSKLNLALDEVKNSVKSSFYYFLHLQLQVNSLTSGRLSPSIIPASQLRSILLSIKSQLPPGLDLNRDPETDLFLYYYFLRTQTLLMDDKIVIVSPLRLIETSRLFHIYLAKNLPVLPYNHTKGNQVLLYYKLEGNYIAINKERSMYMILSETEADRCLEPMLHLCDLYKPIKHSSVTRDCLPSLFLEQKTKIENNCELYVKRIQLPTAFHIEGSTYFIVVNVTTPFHVNCRSDSEMTITTPIKPPYGILSIPENCEATSDQITIISNYNNHSNYTIIDGPTELLKRYKLTDFDVELRKFTPDNRTSLIIPKRLDHLTEIPLKYLRNRTLLELEQMPDLRRTTPWVEIALIVFGAIIFAVLVLCLLKRYCKICKIQKSKTYKIIDKSIECENRPVDPDATVTRNQETELQALPRGNGRVRLETVNQQLMPREEHVVVKTQSVLRDGMQLS